MIAEIESDKATFELTAEATGKLEILALDGTTLQIGDLICQIAATDEVISKPMVKKSAELEGVSHIGVSRLCGKSRSPAAAKILAESGILATSVQGWVGGRITKEDAECKLKKRMNL